MRPKRNFEYEKRACPECKRPMESTKTGWYCPHCKHQVFQTTLPKL